MGRLGILWAKTSNHLQRALYLLGLASFALPFVTVKGCVFEKITEYAGYELLAKDDGLPYLIPIGLGILFIALSFLRQHGNVVVRGFISSMRTLLAFAAGYVVGFFPYMQFLPDTAYAAVGQKVATSSWVLVYAASLASTVISIKRIQKSTQPPTRTEGAQPKRGTVQFVFWLLVVLTLGLFGVSLTTTIVWEDAPRYIVMIVTVFTLSLYLALPFAELGLKEQRRWAAVWVVSATLLLLATGILVLLFTEPFVFFAMPFAATVIGIAGLAVGYFADTLEARFGASRQAIGPGGGDES